MEIRMKLRMLRTDRGGEFTSNEFTKYCKENGIARQLTASYSPQQNGVVERRNRTVLSTTRSMMKAMKLPLTFWAEAVKHAIYILNRVPTRALVDKTPYEALYNRKPNLENLRIFGCTAYAKKQPTVALSSCESEFMAATGAACQALWLKRLLSEITGWEEERITLKVDNIQAIALVKNPVFHGRSKHIDICYHFIRECVENGHINVEHISGKLQRADILTKALPRLKFVTMRQMLGVQDIGRSNDRD
nr:zinc finger, CCHC-type [Tanacetum cinerariifolium]